jgi:hypothetical protein
MDCLADFCGEAASVDLVSALPHHAAAAWIRIVENHPQTLVVTFCSLYPPPTRPWLVRIFRS